MENIDWGSIFGLVVLLAAVIAVARNPYRRDNEVDERLRRAIHFRQVQAIFNGRTPTLEDYALRRGLRERF